jgi:hypothetical protein
MLRLGNYCVRAAAAAVLLATSIGPVVFGDSPHRRFSNRLDHGSSQRSSNQRPAQNFEVLPLPLPPGAIGGYGVSISNRREVAGQIINPDGTESTVVYSGGSLEQISHPDEIITSVPSISGSGDILFGNWGDFVRQTAGTFNRRTRTFQPFPAIAGKPVNIGWEMNDAGVALGSACEGDFINLAQCVYWLRRNGTYEFISLPQLDQFLMRNINNRGQISGQYLLAPPFDYRAFIYENGTVNDLPIPLDAAAFGINNQGQVLLNAEFSPTDFFRPALYDRGSITRLPDAPGMFSTVWFGLNERGDLIGGATPDFFSPPLPFVAVRK